jgi:inner membrane protein
MASVFTHAFAAAAMGSVYAGGDVPARFWLLAMLCAVLPDADVAAFFFDIPYGDTFGHRGFTHSLVFALAAGLAVVALFFREAANKLSLVLFFSLATASHAALDALTNGGLGVAFFSPFSNRRYFFPFRPLEVSPIGVGSFFSEWGLAVIKSELLWVWLPCALLAAALLRRRKQEAADGSQ